MAERPHAAHKDSIAAVEDQDRESALAACPSQKQQELEGQDLEAVAVVEEHPIAAQQAREQKPADKPGDARLVGLVHCLDLERQQMFGHSAAAGDGP